MLGWLKPEEHPEGLLCRPCPVCGYRYGTSWVREQVPQDVIDWLFFLPESKQASVGLKEASNMKSLKKVLRGTRKLFKQTFKICKLDNMEEPMKKTARVIVTLNCNRRCPGCCNINLPGQEGKYMRN